MNITFAPDWSDKTDVELAEIARQAFLLGLKDGRQLSGPNNSHQVIRALEAIPQLRANGRRLIVHTRKLRQVYGAGFDIAKAVSGVHARETSK